MAEFQWANDPDTDVGSDLDSEVPPEDQKWLTTDKNQLEAMAAKERLIAGNPKPMQPTKPAINQAELEAITAPPVGKPKTVEQAPDQLSDIEYRLEKAQYYKLLINSQLLESDSKAAIEVEEEIQTFVHERLSVLMGVKPEVQVQSPGISLSDMSIMIRQATPFSDDEVEALRVLASRLLTKPKDTPVVAPVPLPPGPAPKPVGEPQIKMIAAQSIGGVNIKPVVGEIKRGRGRPRKNPCMTCGLLVCACAKGKPILAETAAEAAMPVAKAVANGQIQTLPDGTRIVEADGRRYKLVKKWVQYRDGTTREEEIPMEITAKKQPSGAKPYPTEAEVAMLADREAQANLGKAPKLLNAAIQAAMNTPAKREE